MSTVSSELNALQLDDILGSSLAAVVKAQGLMAAQLAEFVEKVGFEAPVAGQPLRARTFAFQFTRGELDKTTGAVAQKQVTAEVPLLSILSLPSLGIDQASLDFELKIVAHEEGSSAQAAPGRMGETTPPRKIYALPARKTPTTRPDGTKTVDTTGTLKVNVVVRRQETLGLQKIQSLLDAATLERQS